MGQIRNNLIVELHVPDLNVVKEFYGKLGFEVGMDDAPDDENPGYLTMVRKDEIGDTMLNFYGGDERVYNQSFFKQFPKDTKRGYATSITIPVSNIEAIYNAARAVLGKNIVRELKELEDHGKKWKDFRMVDPFGFYLRFTEPLDWGQE
jgi:predicted lactoylglutathione lyase